jgi:hypothetical protein
MPCCVSTTFRGQSIGEICGQFRQVLQENGKIGTIAFCTRSPRSCWFPSWRDSSDVVHLTGVNIGDSKTKPVLYLLSGTGRIENLNNVAPDCANPDVDFRVINGLPGSGLTSFRDAKGKTGVLFVDTTGAVSILPDISSASEAIAHQIPLVELTSAFASQPSASGSGSGLEMPPSLISGGDAASFGQQLRELVREAIQDELRGFSGAQLGPSISSPGRPFAPHPRTGWRKKDVSERSKWAHKGCLQVPARNNAPHGHFVLQAVVASDEKLWPDVPAKLTYYFLDGHDVQKWKVSETIREWEKYGLVQFVEVHSKDESAIRIKFDGNDGSWSYVSHSF